MALRSTLSVHTSRTTNTIYFLSNRTLLELISRLERVTLDVFSSCLHYCLKILLEWYKRFDTVGVCTIRWWSFCPSSFAFVQVCSSPRNVFQERNGKRCCDNGWTWPTTARTSPSQKLWVRLDAAYRNRPWKRANKLTSKNRGLKTFKDKYLQTNIYLFTVDFRLQRFTEKGVTAKGVSRRHRRRYLEFLSIRNIGVISASSTV